MTQWGKMGTVCQIHCCYAAMHLLLLSHSSLACITFGSLTAAREELTVPVHAIAPSPCPWLQRNIQAHTQQVMSPAGHDTWGLLYGDPTQNYSFAVGKWEGRSNYYLCVPLIIAPHGLQLPECTTFHHLSQILCTFKKGGRGKVTAKPNISTRGGMACPPPPPQYVSEWRGGMKLWGFFLKKRRLWAEMLRYHCEVN